MEIKESMETIEYLQTLSQIDNIQITFRTKRGKTFICGFWNRDGNDYLLKNATDEGSFAYSIESCSNIVEQTFSIYNNLDFPWIE